MKRKLALPLILALFCSVAPAQKITKAKASPAVAAFADSLANLRAAYYAYFRMWDDLDAPAPRVRRDPAYYKLFVPPTYYSGRPKNIILNTRRQIRFIVPNRILFGCLLCLIWNGRPR